MAKRVFISFAIEDAYARDFLRGQARNANSPFEFLDYSVKEPWSTAWKERCRTRIRGCHGVVVILSSNSLAAAGQKWEIRCAIEEGIPLIGMYAQKDDHAAPSEMDGQKKISWSWNDIAAFIDSL